MLFTATVHTLIYQDKIKNFYILKVVLQSAPLNSGFSSGSYAVVKGNLVGIPIKVGTRFRFEGALSQSDKHGLSISVSKGPLYNYLLRSEDVRGVLVSECISEGYVSQMLSLCEKEGLSIIKELGKDVQEAKCYPATIPESHRDLIQAAWLRSLEYTEPLGLLTQSGIPQTLVNSLWLSHKSNLISSIKADPKGFAMKSGISVKYCNNIFKSLGVSIDEINHLELAVLQVLSNPPKDGSTYYDFNDFYNSVVEISGRGSHLKPLEVANALKNLNRTAVLEVTEDRSLQVYPYALYSAESRSSQMLHHKLSMGNQSEQSSILLEEVIARACADSIYPLTEDQRAAVRRGLTEPVSILTGGPGTGKTTCLKVLYDALSTLSQAPLMMAPTGVAATRLSTVVGSEASTIHRALGAKGSPESDLEELRGGDYSGKTTTTESASVSFNKSKEEWAYSNGNPHSASVIIVDECSMVSMELLLRILEGTSESCRFIFVGDPDQIPSVEPGNVLADLIACGLFPVTHLGQVFRQEAGSLIEAAHSIVNQCMPPRFDSDFVLQECFDDDQVYSRILEYSQDLQERGVRFQVLSPKHNGVLGVTNLNEGLRNTLNPKRLEAREIGLHSSNIVREGDKIMFTKNNYDLNVFNGTLARVVSFAQITKKDGRPIDCIVCQVETPSGDTYQVEVPILEAGSAFRLAYAATVHKYQGNEVDVVVMPITPSLLGALSRNLLYTAVTRAKKKVVLFGSREALQQAILTDRSSRRTKFVERLKKL